jgi:zinc protease
MQKIILTLIIMLAFSAPAKAAPPMQEVSWRDVSAWLVTDHSLPLITVEMNWHGGTAGEAQAGLTMLMARLMNEGAGDLDAQGFQKAMADKAISLGFNANHDDVSATLRCLSRYRATCFALLRMAVTAPRFDAEAIARMKGEQQAALRRAQQSPSSLASQKLAQLAYPNHPYGRSKNGTAQSIETIERDALLARHKTLLARDNLKVAIVGDMTRAAARSFMRDVFGGLPAKANVAAHPKTIATQGPKAAHIQRAGPQTSLVFAHQGIDYEHDLFFAGFVMNSILGGSGFSSRLTEQVREARGLAYSVYSYFSISDKGSLWRGSVASDNKTAQEAMDVIRAEMVRIAKDGVSEKRLEAAKTYLTGAYALRFDSGKKIAGQLIGLQVAGRDASYLKTRNARIMAVTQDDIRQAAQLLMSDKLLLVSVGGTAVTLAPRR